MLSSTLTESREYKRTACPDCMLRKPNQGRMERREDPTGVVMLFEWEPFARFKVTDSSVHLECARCPFMQTIALYNDAFCRIRTSVNNPQECVQGTATTARGPQSFSAALSRAYAENVCRTEHDIFGTDAYRDKSFVTKPLPDRCPKASYTYERTQKRHYATLKGKGGLTVTMDRCHTRRGGYRVAATCPPPPRGKF